MVESNQLDNQNKLVCVGKIISAHGIQGLVKVKSFTENPKSLTNYGALQTKDGKSLELQIVSLGKDGVILARIKNILDRNQAETFRNIELFIPRTSLPEIDGDDEFYYEDLVGLAVILDDGTRYGKVTSLGNYGSCDVIEIIVAEDQSIELYPFTSDIFPEIDLEQGYIVLIKPEIEFVNDNNPD